MLQYAVTCLSLLFLLSCRHGIPFIGLDKNKQTKLLRGNQKSMVKKLGPELATTYDAALSALNRYDRKHKGAKWKLSRFRIALGIEGQIGIRNKIFIAARPRIRLGFVRKKPKITSD